MIEVVLISYCTFTFGIHGGEFITGVDRQARNALCALPFGIVAYAAASTHYDFPIAIAAFVLAYVGANMGFNKWPLWFKGFVTFPLGGFVALPLAYLIGNKTKWTNVFAEYLSGTLYGVLLSILLSLGGA